MSSCEARARWTVSPCLAVSRSLPVALDGVWTGNLGPHQGLRGRRPSVPQTGGDLRVGGILAAPEELGVHPEEHGHTVPGAGGNNLRLDSRAEPSRDGRVSKIIWPLGKLRRALLRCQHLLPSVRPHRSVAALLHHAAASRAKQTAVGRDSVDGDVPAQQRHQPGRDGDRPNGLAGTMLQSLPVVSLTRVGPRSAGSRTAFAERDLSPSATRQIHV